MEEELWRCPKCGAGLGRPVASMAGSIMGDEEVETYYFCAACQVYFVEYFRDSFTMGESSTLSDELSRAAGDARVALIRRCDRPWDKRCRCEAHEQYFGNQLD